MGLIDGIVLYGFLFVEEDGSWQTTSDVIDLDGLYCHVSPPGEW